MMSEFTNYNQLKKELLPEISPELFKKDTGLAYLTAFMFLLYIICFLLGYHHTGLRLLMAVILGFIAEFLSMANHDILHGTVFRSQRTAILFSIPNSWINLISPSFWMFWHNFHHKSVDRWTFDKRPYEMGYESHGYPVIRKCFGPIELIFYKAFHLTRTQIRFLLDDRYISQRHLQLKRSVFFEFTLIVAVKILLFVWLPFRVWLILEVLPLMIQNVLSGIFLVTQHASALEEKGKIRTFTVFMPKLLSCWFLNVGYHVEHHLFPNIPSKHLPEIHKLLVRKAKPMAAYSLTDALKKVYFR